MFILMFTFINQRRQRNKKRHREGALDRLTSTGEIITSTIGWTTMTMIIATNTLK